MLGSIHPLGERSRNNRWSVTVGAYVAASLVGGAVVGAVAGLLGLLVSRAVGLGATAWAALAATLVAAAIDIAASATRKPVSRLRQVNEDWLSRYRGWVYGVGFGFQLGTGILTTVVSAAVYLAIFFSFLSAQPVAGAAIGLTFGAARALPLLVMRGARGPRELREIHRRLARWTSRMTWSTVLGEVVAIGVVTMTLARS